VDPLPPEVADVVARYLAVVDERLPGAIDGLYLSGSLALDDFHLRQSDVDFVAVSREPLDDAALDELAAIHTELRPPMHFDGIYVTYDELARDPAAARAPAVHEGSLARSGGFEANPVVWHTLAHHAIPVRGPAPDRLAVWSDPGALRHWSVANLTGYWAGLLDRWRRGPTPPRELVLHQYGLPWLVLGVSRLQYTIATGEITSKAGAGRWALDHYDERWRPLISTCLALRQGEAVELYDDLEVVWGDGLAFADDVVANAERPGVTRP
jgi:Aminoglycoside adenylyltransferase, C-terminal domain